MIKLTAFIIILFFTSCVSFVERTGRLLDGSATAQKKISVYRNDTIEITIVQNKDEKQSLLIELKNFPMMTLKGTLPDDSGFFSLTSLEYLGGNIHGWNEYTMEILGEGNLTLNESAEFILTTEIDKVQITQGRIHRYDTRITGNEALINLRNRRDRIDALVSWMKLDRLDDVHEINTIEKFEEYWKPILFPETVPARRRPPHWQQGIDNFIRAEDIRWNTGYTERIFPEELVPVRNSGTLLRDWEEALAWIYMNYMWDNITETLLQLQVLEKINRK